MENERPVDQWALGTEQLAEYRERGYLHLRSAFSRDAAERMVDRIWEVLGRDHGIRRDDPSTWALSHGVGLQELKAEPAFQEVGGPATIGALDCILGPGEWLRPRHWGQLLVTFPSDEWNVPHDVWHTDFGYEQPDGTPLGAVVFGFFSKVEARGGGTTVVRGSHHLLRRFVAEQPAELRAQFRKLRLSFLRSEPWLEDLCRPGPAADRLARLFERDEEVQGVPLRVVELTGEPGDVVITDPWLLHAPAPNAHATPRMMCIQRVKSDPGRGESGLGRDAQKLE